MRARLNYPKLLPTLLLSLCLLTACAAGKRADASDYTPVQWTTFVKVQGQSEPVPAQWLQDEEARIAHSLVLPASVPKPVPFNFASASATGWLPGTASERLQYFNHLCSTEAGEWIFKKVQNVEGFYFARPQGEPTTDTMTDPYGPEMPWIQRKFMLTADTPFDQGTLFVYPQSRNYHFVEQPRRNTKWQSGIQEPYIRLFGYTRIPWIWNKESTPRWIRLSEYTQEPWHKFEGSASLHWKDESPMQVIGIPTLTTRYGYTWRGLKRARDRVHGIAGGEVLIYDLQTKEVLAVRRQFLIASHNPRGEGEAMWEVAASCPQIRTTDGIGLEFTQFAFDVLQTTAPSWTGKKP